MYIIVVPWVNETYAGRHGRGGPGAQHSHRLAGLPWLGVIYYVLMILALVSSGAPSLFVAADRIKAIIPPARNAKNQTAAMIGCCLIYSVVVVIMATGGLTTIVSYYFQYLGYFGQICGVIPMAIVWPILRAKGVKPIIPAPLKSSSGQQK